ncbi:phage holin family protein [Aquibacillus sp. 3ASR75-11]|uniref:Phage holin family protein n=1 Tax=Terrihalobacillus insolitus TaxID=2950438 RepID=A0A9X3WNJ4_9BACI|nr:phage holin family protein [Terrihalobacillus insolitus]MDC3412260.1 phage holin family protein [Terrihalobacillus insolitus]MDC3423047.1 phage holin family protein [Terrihalobacillus insolitus]
MRWLLSLFLNAIAIIAVAQILDSFYVEGFMTAIIASFIVSILNLIVKPILVVLTLPITFVTFGLFLFVINAITLMITQSVLGAAFVIDGFGSAILAAVVIAILNVMLNLLVKGLK